MGNQNSYEELKDYEYKLPPIQQEHCYGRAYAKLLKMRLDTTKINKWLFYTIYDLRTLKPTWSLSIKLIGNHMKFKFSLLIYNSEKKIYEINHKKRCDLYHDKKNIIYNTILYGHYDNCYITLELYADNIHSQLFYNKKIEKEYSLYGYITFNNQDKIPICI